MAANTRYTPAPQRDSLEEPHYPQAPPSYQDAAEPSSGLLGAPRSEGDNVPDDFKVFDIPWIGIRYQGDANCV